MANLALHIKTDVQKELPSIIEFNFEELREHLAQTLEKYNDVLVTKDGLKDAKATRADLNRFKKALNDARIGLGKEWNKPYEEFKSKVDELVSMVDEPAMAIDRQVKAFEDAEKQEKRDAIEKYYTENAKAKGIYDLVPLEKLFDEKWMNKSVSLTLSTDVLFEKICTIRNDLNTIESMDISHKEYLKSAYLSHLNMGAALDARRIYEEEQAKILELEQAQKEVKEPPVTQVVEKPQVAEPIVEDVKTIEVRFFDTTKVFRDEMKALTQKHGIKYGGIKND